MVLDRIDVRIVLGLVNNAQTISSRYETLCLRKGMKRRKTFHNRVTKGPFGIKTPFNLIEFVGNSAEYRRKSIRLRANLCHEQI